ncbi:hypothetical protein ES703_98182 [subsurface metagenome]
MLSVKCALCGNWMSCVETPKKGIPHLWCGICRYGFLLVTKEAIDNLNKSCQEIDESDLPPPTLEFYKKKVEASG